MAARFEKTLVMNYLLKMHGLGAAAPGELPGELGKNKGCLIVQKGPRVLNIGSSISHSIETL